jgi:hypothetical protein
MMSLVSSDLPGPRIGPKVFADVPSAAEMAGKEAEAASARRGRSMMLIISVLLFGALLATVGFAVMTANANTAERTAWDKEKKEMTDKVASMTTELETAQRLLRPYQDLATSEALLAMAKEDLNGALALPTYAPIKSGLTPAENQVLSGQKPWPGTLNATSWRELTARNLQSDRGDLTRLNGKVAELAARLGAPPPPKPCDNPLGCH